MNTFGQIFRLTTFGESHGSAIGGIIDGTPAGVSIDFDAIRTQMRRRRPGQSQIVTQRNEPDEVQFLSGIFEGTTTGTPIGFTIANSDNRSADYEAMRHTFRPSHADYTYTAKYGLRDHRGGGRSSARETAARVAAGAIASQVLAQAGIHVYAYTSQVGHIALPAGYSHYDPALIDSNPVRCPDPDTALRMQALIERVKSAGDTIGGIITGVIKGCPPGLGDPVFGKLQSRLAAAMMSINAAKGFDYGLGFTDACHLGSEVTDSFTTAPDGTVRTMTNHSGGIQGGISNGEDIYFRVAFKPVATLLRDVNTIDDLGQPVTIHARGRHDPCVLPRAVPIVEAMAAMTILDCWLINKTTRI